MSPVHDPPATASSRPLAGLRRPLRLRIAAALLLYPLAATSPARAGGEPAVNWTEDFATDPLAAGRFTVPPGHDPAVFSYNAGGPFLTVHFNSMHPTAWYMRPLDADGGRVLDECDDFEFSVTFRIRSAGFVADPEQFAQIGWGLLNSITTGEDRAGGSASGPYAFDTCTFDYFPNVSPVFGGPTLAATVIHSDTGAEYFFSIDFPFGAESRIDTALGDAAIALDTTYTARIAFSSAAATATLTLMQGESALPINADGAGGPGGFDGDAATIQTPLFLDTPFAVDSFALTAWHDSFNPGGVSVAADVDVFRITVAAPAAVLGDMNRDGVVRGDDIGGFVQTLLAEVPDPCSVRRADFDGNGHATPADVSGFQEALLAP